MESRCHQQLKCEEGCCFEPGPEESVILFSSTRGVTLSIARKWVTLTLNARTPASSLASVWRCDYFDATGEHISLLQGRDVSKVVMKYCQMTGNGLFVLLTDIYIYCDYFVFLSLCLGVALP